MICGFYPVSAGKTFNRADVFKRHLMSVHAVEQTPPNSRKRSPTSKDKTLSAPDPTGNCSTCSFNFSNAQDFYEHLDDCVLKIVQQGEPSETAAARQEAMNDHATYETLHNNDRSATERSAEDIEDDNGYFMSSWKSSQATEKMSRLDSTVGATTSSQDGNTHKDYPSRSPSISKPQKVRRVSDIPLGLYILRDDGILLGGELEVRRA
jgi:hypothetical protein